MGETSVFNQQTLAVTAAAALAATTSLHAATLLGPTPYLSFADSPFNGSGLQIFLEDFEDQLFNAPGVTAVSNAGGTLAVDGGTINTDSVDGDDGVIDGFGRDGFALSEASNNIGTDNLGYTFTFDAAALGGLPTHAGIVWTDGSQSASTQVEFFGPGDVSLGVIGPIKISDNSFAGGTAEDHFFGAINAAGIESFTIRSPGGFNNLTVDHLQYNIVPEPAALAVLTLAGLPLIRRR
ncbi:hypothetical protein [Mucisphaera sp.]|uniref:hypothetical protein n=1 Tax=Mucisphaera sp. TaxID=2913024 RepID=UPI003D12A96D